jgi:hypothetical protein
MTNPYDALRQARELIADSYDGQKQHADLHYHLAQRPTLAAKVHAATYERAAENVKRMESALFSIDLALAGEGAAGDVILPTVAPAIEPNVAMECLLETMRDNPGAISVYAAVGAVKWALETITTLRSAALAAVPTPAIVRPEDVSDQMIADAMLDQDWATTAVNQLVNKGHSQPFSKRNVRRLIAWAMTRRAPVSDAAVEAFLDNWPGLAGWRDRQNVDWRLKLWSETRAALEAAGRV